MLLFVIPHHQTLAAPPDLNFTVNMSEAVTVNTGGGTPRIAVDVGGQTRYASYASGSGSAALTFAYAPTIGDLDLDGIALSSPVDLNGGTITDLNGNPETNLTFTVPNTSGIKIDYPSLSMDFIYDADGRYTLNGTAYNDLTSFLGASGGTFSRASIGTTYAENSAGSLISFATNQPRITDKGLLIEEQKTNLALYSSGAGPAWTTSAFGTAPFANFTTTTNYPTIAGPDGTFTATRLQRTPLSGTDGNCHVQNVAVGAGTYTMSFYARTTSGGTFNTAFGVCCTGINSQTVVTFDGTWRRYYRTVTLSSPVTTGFRIITHSSAEGPVDLLVWGFQVEVGNFPTSYIPTTTAAVTRAADNLNIPTASWYNQNAGSFFNDISWQSSTGSLYPTFFRVDGAGGNKWHAYYNQSGGNIAVDGFTNGVSQGAWGVASSTSGTAKISAAQELNNANAAFNGTIKTLDTIWSPPNVSQLNLYGSNANKWFGKIKYYPIRTSDAQLQLLTQ